MRADAAAERAVSYGDPRYMTVKNILEKGLERLPTSSGGAASELAAFLHGDAAFDLKE